MALGSAYFTAGASITCPHLTKWPHRQRLFHCWSVHHMPALGTGAQLGTFVEVFEVGLEIGFDVFQFEDGLV